MDKKRITTLEDFGDIQIRNLGTEVVDEKAIREAVTPFSNLVPGATQEEIEKAIKNLQTRYFIRMDTGTTLRNKDTYKKWYHASLATREQKYWDRYKRYLLNDVRLPSQVIDKTDHAATEIMDSLADPSGNNSFSRKGLVIGSVQSGKTSNYIALMNKAADSGYKVIILLTGTIEKLRQQTQMRVDDGFIGSDSKAQLLNKNTVSVGVGLIEQLPVSSLTTTAKDFGMREAIKIDGQKGPVVFVIKKNKAILQKLEKWLRLHNKNPFTGKIEAPLLMIDDEADNASVNTAKGDEDPTVINHTIRDILDLFSKSSYVGFTATPFANIFIDPKIDDEEEIDDLFPRDFIYLLEQPSNYVGPSDMYREDGRYHYMIRNNDDVGEVLPQNHKNGTNPARLPNSLKEAIMVFFLANAIRDIRGDTKKHRSMLIHISRFIIVQNNVCDLVDDFIRDLKIQIQNYIFAEEENMAISNLKRIFEKEFGMSKVSTLEKLPISETWEQVKESLHKSVAPIQTKVINSGNAAKGLNYDEYPDGLRIVAVGGLSLARGLTLEGLMTSYFFRNTKMYDTLMQMGRWFGYRDGYADLCRLWTSTESAEWYAHIAVATEELRMEIKRMADQNKRPIEFGLKVRSSEDYPLIITARNKMRNAELMEFRKSLNGQVVETPILSSNPVTQRTNNALIGDWLESIKGQFVEDMSYLHFKRPTYKNVPKSQIIYLLEEFDLPYINDIESIIENIKNSESKIFDEWDVVVASTESGEEKIKFGPLNIFPLERSFNFYESSTQIKYIRMSGSKRRLGATNFSQGGLNNEQFELINSSVRTQRENLGLGKDGQLKAASEYMYFNTGIQRNPLLVIYPIKLKYADAEEMVGEEVEFSASKIQDSLNEVNRYLDSREDELVTGVSIGIPDIEGVENVTYIYAMNIVEQRKIHGLDIDSSDLEGDTDND